MVIANSTLISNFKLDFIRELPETQRDILIKINKDKKRWYTTENAASGNKLFKTSFHDYAHSAPKTMGDLIGKPSNPLGLDNASENLARHTEDSVLQHLPWSLPKSQITEPIRVMQEAQQQSDIQGAYDALYKLGQYSVEKKNGLASGTYPASKVMLNKFSYMSCTVNFANAFNKTMKNAWLRHIQQDIDGSKGWNIGSPEAKAAVKAGRRKLYSDHLHTLDDKTQEYERWAANKLGHGDYLPERTDQDNLNILNTSKSLPYTDVEPLMFHPDEHDIAGGVTEPYHSGLYKGFPKTPNAFMQEPIPDDVADQALRGADAVSYALHKRYASPFGINSELSFDSRPRYRHANT